MSNILIYTPQMALYGGMESHLCLLAQACASAHHRVVMITTSNSLNDESRRALRASGVVLRELPVARGRASNGLKFFWLSFVALQLRTTPWQIIYTNGQSGLARIVWFAARKGARIIHHHHTAASDEEIASWRPAFRRVLRNVPELIACSRSTKQQLERTLQRRNIQFLPYLTPEIIPGSAVRDLTYHSESLLHFGFIGRLVSDKGIDEICELSQRSSLAMIQWHLYGEGEQYTSDDFQKYPKVIFHGRYRDLEHYGRILGELDAMVLLSRHSEGMPLSLIEGLSAGLPWIATDRGGTREIAVEANSCILIPADATLDVMERFVVEFVRRIRSGLTSRHAQRQVYDLEFSPPAVTGQWLEFFTTRPEFAESDRSQS